MSSAAGFKKRVRKPAVLVATKLGETESDDNDGETANALELDKKKKLRGLSVAESRSLHVSSSSSSLSTAAAALDAALLHDRTFASSRSAKPAGPADAGATALYVVDGERAEQLEAESRRAALEAEAAAAGVLGDGVYRGQAGFTKFGKSLADEKSVAKTARTGPQTGSMYQRRTTVVDYDMAVCKPYKETGTCGYGDNCIYLHDRTNYKSGWQIDKEYDDAVKEGRDPHAVVDERPDVDADADDMKTKRVVFGVGAVKPKSQNKATKMPTSDAEAAPQQQQQQQQQQDASSCGICSKPPTKPVKTRCSHFFCQDCAKKRIVKGKLDCATCGASTNGILQPVVQ